MVEITFEKQQLTSIVHFCWMNFDNKWRVVRSEYKGMAIPILNPMSAEQMRMKAIQCHSAFVGDTVRCRANFAFENPGDAMLFKLTWGGK